MQSNRLGCFTATGIFASLITLVLMIGIGFITGGDMFSPGKLNNHQGESLGGVSSHAQLTECKACHTAPWESAKMADRCIQCHQDVGRQLADPRKLHGAIAQKNPNDSCRDCHSDHHGAWASLTKMDSSLFPHDTFGFSLAKHQFTNSNEPIKCTDCHSTDLTTFAPDSCQACHAKMDIAFTQAHILSFGISCLACHDGVDRYGKRFDHNEFAFKLTGKHVQVNCTKCHLNAHSVGDLQKLASDCNSCHKKDDAHAGAFGTDCGACHSSDGWKPAKFDHNLSSFKLEGKHANVKCDACHKNNVFKGTPTDCYSCHQKDDEHKGQNGTDCAACHNASSWKDASFDHSRFPLTGGHANVECKKCHTNGSFSTVSADCVSCHADPGFHAGAFGSNCVTCHSTVAWSPAGFKLSHPQPQVEDGGSGINHGGATCRQCHPSTVSQAVCTACHQGNPGGG